MTTIAPEDVGDGWVTSTPEAEGMDGDALSHAFLPRRATSTAMARLGARSCQRCSESRMLGTPEGLGAERLRAH